MTYMFCWYACYAVTVLYWYPHDELIRQPLQAFGIQINFVASIQNPGLVWHLDEIFN